MAAIRANSVLPAHREALTLHTADGVRLINWRLIERVRPLD